MPQSRDPGQQPSMGDDLLNDMLDAFRQDDFDAGLDLFDDHLNEMDVSTRIYVARGLANKGYAHEAIYMIHDLVFETKGGQAVFRRHAGGEPIADTRVLANYIWALTLFERRNEEYAYAASGSLPPLSAAAVFDAYREISPRATSNHYFVTDGLRAHFETIVRGAGHGREYDLETVRRTLDIVDGLREAQYRIQGNGPQFISYKNNDRFLMWEACLYALTFDHPKVGPAKKQTARRNALRVLNDYFTLKEFEKNNQTHRGRTPKIPDEIGALVYSLKDDKLIGRLEAIYKPRAGLSVEAEDLARDEAEAILRSMQENASQWPFVRIGVRSESVPVGDAEGDVTFGARAFAEDGRRPQRAHPAAEVRPAAVEVGPRGSTAAAQPEERSRAEPQRLGRSGTERREIVTKKGPRTIIVQRKPRRTATTGKRPSKPGGTTSENDS